MTSVRGIRAGAAYVELYANDNKLVRGLQRASRRLKAFGAGVRQMGMKLVGLGAVIGGPLLGASKVFASMGDQVAKMAARTGLSAEALSELAFAAEQSGSNIEELEKGIRTMQRSINDAGRDLSTAVDALDDLNLTYKQLQNLSPEEQFKLIADRIGGIADPSKRAALAMMLLGRAGTKLLPMMAGGAKGIEALQQQARELGLTISTEDAAAAAKFTDQMNVLWKVLKMGVFVIGSALGPVLSDLSKWIVGATKKATAWLKQNKQIVVTVLKVAAAIVAGGVAFIVLGAAIGLLGSVLGAVATVITGVGTAVGILGAVLAALLSPIGLVITGVVALGAYLVYATGAGAKALTWLGEKFNTLKDDAVSAYQGIADAMAAGDIGLAAKILWLTLKMEWQKGTHALLEKWIAFKSKFMGVIDDFVYGGQVIWSELLYGMEIGWTKLVAALKTEWATFAAWHKDAVESSANWIAKRWIELQGLFDDTIDVEVAKKFVDEQSSERKSEIATEEQKAIQKANQAKQKALDKAQTDRQKRLLDIGKKDAAATSKRQKEYAAQLGKSADALAAARQEWKDALTDARNKRSRADGGPGKMDSADDLLNRVKNSLAGLGDLLASKATIGVRGTFNAAAASGLAAGGAVDRIAKATEDTAKSNRKIEQNTKRQQGFT